MDAGRLGIIGSGLGLCRSKGRVGRSSCNGLIHIVSISISILRVCATEEGITEHIDTKVSSKDLQEAP